MPGRSEGARDTHIAVMCHHWQASTVKKSTCGMSHFPTETEIRLYFAEVEDKPSVSSLERRGHSDRISSISAPECKWTGEPTWLSHRTPSEILLFCVGIPSRGSGRAFIHTAPCPCLHLLTCKPGSKSKKCFLCYTDISMFLFPLKVKLWHSSVMVAKPKLFALISCLLS